MRLFPAWHHNRQISKRDKRSEPRSIAGTKSHGAEK